MLETQLGLKRIAGINVTGDFLVFENKSRGIMRRLLNMEKGDDVHEGNIRRHHGEV